MKKTHLRLLAVAAAAFAVMALVLAGCSSNNNAGDDAADADDDAAAAVVQGVGEDNTLTVGFDQDFPPYGYIGDDGNFAGFDLDLAAEVASRNGWDLELLPVDWDAKDLELSSGTIDVIWNGFTIEGRKDGYQFTDPYMNNTQVVVVRADSGITSVDDLAGKNVLTQADSSAYNLLTSEDMADVAATFASLATTPNYNNAFMELESGAVDAVAIDEPVALFQVAGKEDLFTILDETLSTEHYGVGALLGNVELVQAIQATLVEMDADGTIQEIASKYADQGISYDNWCLGQVTLDEIAE